MEKTITIKNSHIPELIEVFGRGYQEQIMNPENPGEMIDNPETKTQFANNKFDKSIRRFIHGHIMAYRQEQMQLGLDETEILE